MWFGPPGKGLPVSPFHPPVAGFDAISRACWRSQHRFIYVKPYWIRKPGLGWRSAGSFVKGDSNVANLTPYVVTWAVLALVVLGLALYRNLFSMKEDNYLHLSEGEERQIPAQVAFDRRLGALDRWGQGLTVVALAGGLVLAFLFVYRTWLQTQ